MPAKSGAPSPAATDASSLSDAVVADLVAGRHADPFAVLGMHDIGGSTVVRAFVPGAESLDAVAADGEVLAHLTKRHPDGLFEGRARRRARYRLRARSGDACWFVDDPYAYGPVLGQLDDWLIGQGTHTRLYDRLGAHPIVHEDADGVPFAVWAPNARRVSVVGGFNAWDGRRHVMRKRLDTGVWEIFLPGVREGDIYKYEVIGADGACLPLKADPVGFAAELRPSTASLVSDASHFAWSDQGWTAARAKRDWRRTPISIYEVHAGSWRREDGRWLTWDELADSLVPYAVDLGFTHIEFMPVNEHPLDASWGYQPIGLFAPTSRFGEPAGFARLVDRCHAAGLAVILDWVPAHFPTDPHGLINFDGTPLYEHADPRLGFHPDWNTAIYDYGRQEVANYLIANALFWLDRYHVDGLRVDAVASMLYLDYSRAPGEWRPNPQGGNENLEAIGFLRRLNETVYSLHPGVVMIAEESTTWPGVSHPVYAGGLGFGFKWNMGWMHDTLAYVGRTSAQRRWHHQEITFGLMYAFAENFVLPLSHDEFVHGKGTLFSRIPGDTWQRFATLRAYLAFMWAYPGKKLLFMGQEFAQVPEWNFAVELEWHELDSSWHRGIQSLVRDCNRAYVRERALHERDCEGEGFRWIEVADSANSVFAWVRFGGEGALPVAVVVNFTANPHDAYRIGLPRAGTWRVIVNSDDAAYGGSNWPIGAVVAARAPHGGFDASASIRVPPLAAIWLVADAPDR